MKVLWSIYLVVFLFSQASAKMATATAEISAQGGTADNVVVLYRD